MAFVYSPGDAVPIAAGATLPEATKALAGPSEPSEETQPEDVAEPAASSADVSAGANVPTDFLDPIFNRERVASSYGLSSDELKSQAGRSVTQVTVKDDINRDTEHESGQNRSDSLPGQGDSGLQEPSIGIPERSRRLYSSSKNQHHGRRFNPQPPSKSEVYGILPRSDNTSITGRKTGGKTKEVNLRFTRGDETLVYSSTQNGEFPPVFKSQSPQTAERDHKAASEDLGQPISRDRASAEQAQHVPTSNRSGPQRAAGSKTTTQTVQTTRKVSARINDNKAYGTSTQKNGIVYYPHPAQGSEPSTAGIIHRSHQDERVTLPGGVTATFQGNEKAETAVQENLIVGSGFTDFKWGDFSR